jgi:hypothetical protein
VLKTKNLPDFSFLTIRWFRMKALVETRIEHAVRMAADLRFSAADLTVAPL